MSESDSIVMMCFNALKPHITNPSVLSTVPSNVVLVEYGFQVLCTKPDFNSESVPLPKNLCRIHCSGYLQNGTHNKL